MRIIAIIAAVVAALAVTVALAVTPTPTPEPQPIIQFQKTATVQGGGFITYTISVTNSGNSQTGELTIYDTLPGGIDWFVSASTIPCSLTPSATTGRLVLACGPFVVDKRQLNDAKDNFINGFESVSISGVALTCGQCGNVAILRPNIAFAQAAADIPCPATPTPTATPVTPVPTVAPTQTPAPQPTATVAPPTPAPTLAIPKAPATGDSAPQAREGGIAWPSLAILAGAILFGLSYAGWRRYR